MVLRAPHNAKTLLSLLKGFSYKLNFAEKSEDSNFTYP